MANPRQREVEAALQAFYAERAPKLARRRRYARVVGGVVGSRQHSRRKRNQQRRNAGTWRFRP